MAAEINALFCCGRASAERGEGDEPIGDDRRFVSRLGEDDEGRPGRDEGPGHLQPFLGPRPLQLHQERAGLHHKEVGPQQGHRHGQLLLALSHL